MHIMHIYMYLQAGWKLCESWWAPSRQKTIKTTKNNNKKNNNEKHTHKTTFFSCLSFSYQNYEKSWKLQMFTLLNLQIIDMQA